jgi:tetratricopeptide (TPR) repeat protein
VDLEQQFDAGKRFEVLRWLGAGGMGVVYEAYDRELQEVVALKTLRHADGRWLERFKREFRALHDLAHPNLVALGELFDGESEPFFSMELVRGVTFLTYVRGAEADSATSSADTATAATRAPDLMSITRPLRKPSEEMPPSPPGPHPVEPIAYDETRLRAALKQLAVAIAAIHDAGKVHRDIKPSNILVTDEGRVVLLDFGLVAETATEESTEGSVVGTVAYMAPEQSLSGDVTPAADWYSLGVLLFESLTGALPHTGRTPYDLLIRKHKVMAAPPRQFVPTVPPDLDALCSELLATKPGSRPAARDIFDRLGVEDHLRLARDSSHSRASLSGAARFVGRTAQLAALRDAYDSVDDAPLIYIVEGVSGVGKSHLVARFLEQIAEDEPEAVVLNSRCYEREVVSYKALDGIADNVARFLDRLPAEQLGALMPLRPALLARLFPVFKRVEAIAAAGVVPDVPDPHDQRLRMFATLRELFMRLTQRRRMVWYIDDIQWTDADSLVLLQDLIAHEDRFPVFIIATMRPVDSDARKALLAELETLAPIERLRLGELPHDEARELAQQLLPGRDADSLDAVAAGAGGHPLFLHELARHSWTVATSSTFDEMLTARIERLSADVQTLLEIVAVNGGPLPQDVAAIAAELSAADQINAARILRAAHLARTDGVRRTDRIVTFHDRVREHVSTRLETERRTHLHERLALALEQTGAAEHSPRALVRHARAAGRHALAAKYAEMAARHAVASLAFDQAAEFFATAIELGDYDDERTRNLRIDLATALMNAGRAPESAATFMVAADGADPAVRLDCQRQAADQWIITGHLEEGMSALRSSLADIGEPIAATPRRALARVLWNRARLRLRGMRHVRRRESQVPEETLRRLDVLKAVAHGLAMVDNIRGADFNGRFLLLALRTGEVRRLVGAMATEVVFLASQGGSAGKRARRLYDDMVELAEHCPDQAYANTWILLADGATSFFEGRFTPAVESLEKAEDIFAEGPKGLTYERNNTRVFRVHTLRLLGRLRQLTQLAAELVRTGRQRGDRYLESTIRLLQGQALLAHDDRVGARDSIVEVRWSPPEDGFHLQHWYELRARAELALYEGTAATALDELAAVFSDLDRSMLLRVKIVRADAIALRARILVAAAAEGHAPDGGRANVSRIARRLDGERAGYANVYALLLRAGMSSFGSGHTDEEAAGHLREAIEQANEHDMGLHLAAARDRLGRIVGGDEGAALREAAAAYATAEGVVEPDRMYEAIAPGIRR